jgi:hypothetical protein
MLKFWGERPGLLIVCLLLTVGFLGAYPLPSLFVGATLLVGWGLKKWVQVVDEDHARKIANMARLEQDLTIQDRWWAMGDPRGTFGRYY